jgi:hypothetical protein
MRLPVEVALTEQSARAQVFGELSAEHEAKASRPAFLLPTKTARSSCPS